MEKIFVSVIACRERYLKETIISALNNAKIKDRIYIGVVNTVLPEDKDFLFNDNKVLIKNFHANTILGIGFSRKKAIDLCPEGIDYILQVDGHTIFAKNWDSILIDYFKKIEKNIQSSKVIISQFSDVFIVKENNMVFIPNLGSECDPNNLIIEDRFLPAPVYLSISNLNRCLLEGYPASWGEIKDWDNKDYLEITNINGAFVFAKKEMFEEIPHDVRCYWGADESVFGMRAWTRGYKIFTIKKFVFFHLFRFEFDEDGKDKNDWRERIDQVFYQWQLTFETIRDIFTGKEFGIFGALNKERLLEYENATNFNFKSFYKEMDRKNLDKTNRV